jgi:hypothetical protein
LCPPPASPGLFDVGRECRPRHGRSTGLSFSRSAAARRGARGSVAPPSKADAETPARKKSRTGIVEPAPTDPALVELAAALPPELRLGTSSWSYPGWANLVWDGEYAESVLSKNGLSRSRSTRCFAP